MTNTTDSLGELARRQMRLKRGGRQWLRLQKLDSGPDAGRERTSGTTGSTTSLGRLPEAQANGLVVIEDLKHKNMRRTTTARGTPENPGQNVRAKSGLNRSLANARPGAMQAKLRRHCEKRGTMATVRDGPPSHQPDLFRVRIPAQTEPQEPSGIRVPASCLTRVHADVNGRPSTSSERGQEFHLLCQEKDGPKEGKVATGRLRRVGIPSSSDSPTNAALRADPSWEHAPDSEPDDDRAQAVRNQREGTKLHDVRSG